MKALKLSILALVLAGSVQLANAQVSIGVSIGSPAPRRVVVVDRPVVYERPIVYHRPRTVVVERYNSPRYRQVYYRGDRRYYSSRPSVYHRPVAVHHRRW